MHLRERVTSPSTSRLKREQARPRAARFLRFKNKKRPKKKQRHTPRGGTNVYIYICVYVCACVYLFPVSRAPDRSLCAREAFSGPPRPQCEFYLAVTLVDRVDPALDSLGAARTERTSSRTTALDN